VASSPHDFKLLVAGDGRTSTSMDDITASVDEERPEPAPAPKRTPPPAAPGAGVRNGFSAPPPGVPA
jgi:hypothetical protein